MSSPLLDFQNLFMTRREVIRAVGITTAGIWLISYSSYIMSTYKKSSKELFNNGKPEYMFANFGAWTMKDGTVFPADYDTTYSGFVFKVLNDK